MGGRPHSGRIACSIAFVALACAACGSDATATGTVADERRAYADLVLTGGTILTMDPDNPEATAIAIRGSEIVAVGADEDVTPLVGASTKVVKLRGRGVTPGLVDAHAHLYGLGTALEQVELRGAESAEAAAAKAAAFAEDLLEGEWVVGRGWDENRWEPKQFPTHEVLDAALGARPAALRRVDGHALWASAAAMELAGITRDTPDPVGGKIVRDAAGEPTGVFIDTAMPLIQAKIPAPPVEARRRRILRAADIALSHGLTGVHDMGIDDATARAYRELAAAEELPLRVYAFFAGDAKTAAELAERRPVADDGESFFAMRAVKFYADGALGSRGARLLADYTDDPSNRGLWITEPPAIERAVRLAVDNGWQVGIHAIGDAANRAVLDAYEKAIAEARARGETDLRLRVEHAQVVHPDDLPRFAKLGVIASMQPTHCTSDMPWAPDRLGPERIRGAYAWRTILDAGGRIAAGSDFPVEEVPPLHGLHAAVTRTARDGTPEGGWAPEQRMTLAEAIRAFTVAPAYAAFVEDHRGMLRPGYVADVTVYDRALNEGTLLDTAVDLTIVGGRLAYRRN